MKIDAVLVLFTLEGHQITYETSGTLLNTDLVLLTGTALIPLMQQEKWISLFVNSSSPQFQLNSYIQKVFFRVLIEAPAEVSDNGGVPNALYSYEGRVVGVWKCPLVSQAVKKLFSNWTIGHAGVENNLWNLPKNDIDLSKELMSIFILVKCKDRRESEQNKETITSDIMQILLNLLSQLRNANRGQEVAVVSTPFGHKDFINSLCRGVISNAVGCENCIILSDARTVSGCEGGPIFLSKGWREDRKSRKLIGLVTCPLTWWRGEWVGLTIGVSLLPVIRQLLSLEKDITPSLRNRPESLPDSSLFKFIDESVVLVRSRESWGSGVVLNASSGIVLTCSHVVKDDKVVSVFSMRNQWSADVIFSSQNDVAYDLAVLKIKKKNLGYLKEVEFAETTAKPGETVIAAGFPFFSEEDDENIRPTVVTGCVSRVNPYMIQTTCCVQSGFSGGPLLRDGKLLGIIVSNAIGSGVLYPHINFITPSSVFKEPILKYIRTNDIRNLKELESSNVEVQYLWKLHTCKL